MKCKYDTIGGALNKILAIIVSERIAILHFQHRYISVYRGKKASSYFSLILLDISIFPGRLSRENQLPRTSSYVDNAKTRISRAEKNLRGEIPQARRGIFRARIDGKLKAWDPDDVTEGRNGKTADSAADGASGMARRGEARGAGKVRGSMSEIREQSRHRGQLLDRAQR